MTGSNYALEDSSQKMTVGAGDGNTIGVSGCPMRWSGLGCWAVVVVVVLVVLVLKFCVHSQCVKLRRRGKRNDARELAALVILAVARPLHQYFQISTAVSASIGICG